jgi:hypothetical protein
MIFVNHVVAHRFLAGLFTHRTDVWSPGSAKFGCRPGGYCMVASDQHQPASSRAMATLATSGFLPRSVK